MEKTIYNQDYLCFLELLIQARKSANITQEELAKRLNQTQSFVSKCERRERRLDVIEARQFCKAIGIDFTGFIQQLEVRL